VVANVAESPGYFLVVPTIVTSGSGLGFSSVTDSVNSGGYSFYGSPVNDVTNSAWIQFAYKTANAAGTPTVTAVYTGGGYGYQTYLALKGFNVAPTVDSTLTQNFPAGTAGTAVSISAGTTHAAKEMVIIAFTAGYGLLSVPTGWTEITGGALASGVFYQYFPTAGTAVTFVGTLGQSTWYDAQVFGVYDA
jgi:hypothetical protein